MAEVRLAVAYWAVFRNVGTHICSFTPLEPRFMGLEEHVSRSSNSSTITFHPVDGLPMIATLSARFTVSDLIHGPGISNAVTKHRLFPNQISTWEGGEYLHIYDKAVEVVQNVDRDVVVVDLLLNILLNGCRTLSRRHLVLSPNTFKD